MSDIAAHSIPCERCESQSGKSTGMEPSLLGVGWTDGPCKDCDGGLRATFAFSEVCPGRQGYHPGKTGPNAPTEWLECGKCTDQPKWVPAGRVAVVCDCEGQKSHECETCEDSGHVRVTLTDADARSKAVAIIGNALAGILKVDGGGREYEALAAAEMLRT